jgi:hypothetical protein
MCYHYKRSYLDRTHSQWNSSDRELAVHRCATTTGWVPPPQCSVACPEQLQLLQYILRALCLYLPSVRPRRVICFDSEDHVSGTRNLGTCHAIIMFNIHTFLRMPFLSCGNKLGSSRKRVRHVRDYLNWQPPVLTLHSTVVTDMYRLL